MCSFVKFTILVSAVNMSMSLPEDNKNEYVKFVPYNIKALMF